MTGESLDIGTGNFIESPLLSSSAAIGDTHLVWGFAQAVFGQNNYVHDGDNLASGGFNTLFGWANLVAGDSNELMNSNSANVTAISTAMFGSMNCGDNLIGCLVSGSMNVIVSSTACLVSGTCNELDSATDSAAIGHGLILYQGSHSQIIIGHTSVRS